MGREVRGGSSGWEEREWGDFSRVCTTPAYLHPQQEKGGEGVDGGGGEWVGMPVEEKKNHILQLQNSSSRLTAQRVTAVHSVDQCVLSTGAHWTCSLM